MVVYFNEINKIPFKNNTYTNVNSSLNKKNDYSEGTSNNETGNMVGYYVAAGIAAAAVIGGIYYAVTHGCSKSNNKLNQLNVPSREQLENAAKQALKVRAIAAKEKAFAALKQANKIKDETIEYLNGLANKDGKWDFTKIEGRRIYPENADVETCKRLEAAGYNVAEKIITKNEFGGTRIYDFTNRFDNKIIDYMPGDGSLLKPPKIREISLLPGSRDVEFVTIFNEDRTSTLCDVSSSSMEKVIINHDELGGIVDNVVIKNDVVISYNNNISHEFFSFS